MRDRLAVHLDPLGVILQMRGCVQADPVACRLQRRGAQARSRTFAFRPGDVDDRVCLMRISKFGQHGDHAVEVEIRLGEFRGMFQAIIDESIEIVERLVVGGFGVHWSPL